MEYFSSFFSKDLIDLIIYHKHQYSVQQSGSSINTNYKTKDFLAIHLYVGIIKLPRYVDYWSEQFRVEKVAGIVSLKKYQALRKYLHFNDNAMANDYLYYKIQPILDIVKKNCNAIPNEKQQLIYEMMVPFKGSRAGSRKLYIKSKHKIGGFKFFFRARAFGIVYDFVVYGGSDTFRHHQFSNKEENMGLGSKVVLGLCQTISNPAVTIVYIDNFFTSRELMRHLRQEYGILALGTIRGNRLRGCMVPTDKTVSLGTSLQKVDNEKNVVVLKQVDNKEVLLASNFVGIEPITSVKGFSKMERKKGDVPCPNIVKKYNVHMGGVDVADMLIALYRTHFKAKKLYLTIFGHLLNLCVIHAWLLNRREAALMKEKYNDGLKTIQVNVAEMLLQKDRLALAGAPTSVNEKLVKRPSAPRPVMEVRLDKYDLSPICAEKAQCRHYKDRQSRIKCMKCNMTLCLISVRNCFYESHHQ
ncbi:hypothetical protein PR048_010371 [Dryococelus australis]|uniref:PiggyBac transposable element-derived protein domain-containing protein n=1 Tax=Dryococelus australis TaxID=614101 RepID=A0ABQ9I2M6_9NEOP|nr:hypothetical protein PR048_010371 [Dryococelus australis]